MIVIIAIIATIAVIAVMVIIATIGTSGDAENAVLCTDNAEKTAYNHQKNAEKTAYNHPVAQVGALFRDRTRRHSPGRVVPLSRARPAHEEHVLVLLS